jgi:hypothetical protein
VVVVQTSLNASCASLLITIMNSINRLPDLSKFNIYFSKIGIGSLLLLLLFLLIQVIFYFIFFSCCSQSVYSEVRTSHCIWQKPALKVLATQTICGGLSSRKTTPTSSKSSSVKLPHPLARSAPTPLFIPF